MSMIDIHSHILPGVDDGSGDMETSLELLRIAAESGVKTVVATPHCNISDEFENYASEGLDRLFSRLRSEAAREGIQVEVIRGMEVFATEDMAELLADGRVWTLNGTKYFLTEFAFDEDPDFCFGVLSECRAAGFKPIVAHPERYFFIQDDPQIAFEMCRSGYGLQINKGSLLGRFGPEVRTVAERIVDHGLAACVASDAHGVRQRNTYMADVKRLLQDRFGEGYAKLLLEENPSRILRGRELVGYEPIPFASPIFH